MPTPSCQDGQHYPDNRENRLAQGHQVMLAHAVPLPSPDASLGTRGGPQDPAKRRAGGHQVSVADALTHLPTPTASGSESNLRRNPTAGQTLGQAVGMHEDNYARPKLLPTPAVNDMGAGKTPEEWDLWNDGPTMAHQKHGPSLAIEAAKLLPTPKATNNENHSPWNPEEGNLGSAVNSAAGLDPRAGRLTGASTALPSSDGPESSAESPRPRRSRARKRDRTE